MSELERGRKGGRKSEEAENLGMFFTHPHTLMHEFFLK
jgi:hypothetical protein